VISDPPADAPIRTVLPVLRRALGLTDASPEPMEALTFLPELRALASWHRVLGFLEADPHLGPLITLGAAAGSARQRNAEALRDLTEILRILGDASVPVIPFKGPLLSARLFGDPTLRGAHDLDLLVEPERLDDALAALALNYIPIDLPRRVRAAREHHLQLRSQATARLIELHWQPLSPRSGVSAEWRTLWRLASPRTDSGVSYLAMDPAMEAVVVGVHAAQHLAYRLHWLSDVAALVLGLEEHTWERALEIARRWRGLRSLLTGIQAAESVFELPLNLTLARATAAGGNRRVSRWIARRLRSGVAAIPSQIEAWPRWLAMLESWTIRGRVVGQYLFTPIPEDREFTGLAPGADAITGLLRPLLVLKRTLARNRSIQRNRPL
jgi:hypothetical protein